MSDTLVVIQFAGGLLADRGSPLVRRIGPRLCCRLGLGSSGRPVAQRTGDSQRQLVQHTFILQHLIAQAWGVAKGLYGLFFLAEIDIGGDAYAVVAVAQDGRQHLLDIARCFLLVFLDQLPALRRGAVHVEPAGQQRPVLVDHADVLGLQLGHAVGQQIDDGPHLLGLQPCPGAHLQHHRGLGRLPVADHKGAAFLHCQVYPGIVDALEGHDGAGQFAFQAALEAHILDKLAGA